MGNPIAVVIAFRDRWSDPLRRANLSTALQWWNGHGIPVVVVSDGQSGQFNRSAAYNRASDLLNADVLVYSESDMLIDPQQIGAAGDMARATSGLVVPFTEYHYLGPVESGDVRSGKSPERCVPESIRNNGVSVGAVNVVSKRTLRMVGGWDEQFTGSWYDDTAMKIAFDTCSAPTRWVTGPAYHLYHLPGWTGDHLTDEDRAATEANRVRLDLYRMAETPGRIRELTAGAG